MLRMLIASQAAMPLLPPQAEFEKIVDDACDQQQLIGDVANRISVYDDTIAVIVTNEKIIVITASEAKDLDNSRRANPQADFKLTMLPLALVGEK
jgi:hypothetical protein